MRRFFLLPSLMGLAAFLFVSCADGSLDFTRDEIDATVHVGGDSLTIPVGHLEKVTAAEIIDKLNVQYLSVRSDGICGFSMTGTSSMKVDRIDEINFDPVDFEYVNHIDLPSLTGTAVPMSTYSLPIREEIPIRITGEGVSVEILSVNRVVLDRATADIHISFKGIEPLLDNNIRFKGKVVFPDEIRLGEPYAGKNYVPLDETLTSQGIHLSVPLTEVFLDNLKIYEKIEILRDVVVEGDLSGSLSFSDLQSLSGGLDFRFDLLIDRLVPVSAEAKVDYAVDYSDKMYLSQIPEELKQEGIHLDVVNPYLLMGLHHNLSFNVDGNVELTSMKNQQDLHTIGMELSLEGVEDQADIDRKSVV